KGVLLLHYTLLLVPITSLWLTSFLTGKYKYIFLPIIIVVFLINLQYTSAVVNSPNWANGHDFNSWKGMTEVANEVVKQEKGNEFGYFVYAPDAYAYQPRYAMIYNFKIANANS